MRQTICLNLDWKFHHGEADNASYMGYDDRAWRDVTLPHDWSVSEPFDIACSSGTGYLPGGVGWYRRRFTLPEGIEDRRVFVTFGGVYKNSRCWINSHYLGKRPYGYSSFTYELTGRVKQGENVLCVRAEHIELADSRWFTGAGIYRDVTITITDKCFASDVFAYALNVDADSADIAAQAELSGGEALFKLLDADGKEVAQSAAKDGRATLNVPKPKLWSVDNPYLYTLVCEVYNNGTKTDEVTAPFGIRTIRFDADRGFYLNDVNMKLKGVCMHHDAGVLGAAVPMRVWERRLMTLKAAGCNALRCSHNPPDPKLLDICDKLGILVIDEAFDEWEGCKNKWWQGHNVYPPKRHGYSDDFPEWHERDLAGLVRRDRNHPCVILWSIGNEIDYPNDPYVHPSFESMTGNNDLNKPEAERVYDPRKPDASRLPVIARELAEIVRQNDASRPVTAALAYPELSNITGLSDSVDVTGYNYKEALYTDDHANYPARVIMGSENSVSAEAWLAVKHNDYIAGQFLWTGADFLGEAKGWPIRISQAGLLDTAGNPKPMYALRRALWTDSLCASLAVSASGEQYDEAFVWSGESGDMRHISCYTNAERTTLYINGRALETREVGEDARAIWVIPYEAGELRAVCERGGETIECRLKTSGKPARISLTPDRTSLTADGQSVMILDIELLDANGLTADTVNEPIKLQWLGDVELLGIENGNPADLTPFPSAERPCYRGRAVAYIRAGRRAGDVTLEATTRGGLKERLTFKVE